MYRYAEDSVDENKVLLDKAYDDIDVAVDLLNEVHGELGEVARYLTAFSSKYNNKRFIDIADMVDIAMAKVDDAARTLID